MTDYALVVRKGDKYLAEPFHRRKWTKGLPWARTFTNETVAQAAAVQAGGEVRTIAITETD